MCRAVFGPAALAMGLLCGACASGGGGGSDEPAEEGQVIAMSESEGAYALEKKYAMDRGAVTYGEDGTVTGGQRSQFEGKRQIAYGGQWGGKNYDNKQYEKTWWGGKRERKVQQYSGNLDGSRFQAESRMSGKSARQSGSQSRYAGTTAPTTTRQTGAANEAGRSEVSRPTNSHTEWRRGVSPQPKITGYKQHQQMQVEETRRLLGRE